MNNLFTVIVGLCDSLQLFATSLGKPVNFCVNRNEKHSCLGDLSNGSFQTLKGATVYAGKLVWHNGLWMWY